jgi:tripartite-type tricarboxylate transporter receptor subunit TctC
LFYGSGGNGASTHLAGELFNLAAGTKISHIPYKGTGEAFIAVLGNQVPLTFMGISSAKPALEGGRLKALAVTGSKRNDVLPNVPTFQEAGLPGVDSSTHWLLLAPAHTPAAIVQRMNAEVNKVLRDPEIRKRIAALGFEAAGGTPKDLAALNEAEIAKWTQVIKTAHITLE